MNGNTEKSLELEIDLNERAFWQKHKVVFIFLEKRVELQGSL